VPIPNSANKKRIEENINIFDFELNTDDMKVMESYNNNQRIVALSNHKGSPYYPYAIEF
jgi:diketogulonate reductase-like aldo/keto reductase